MVLTTILTDIDVDKFNRLYGGVGLVYGDSYNTAVEQCKKRVQLILNEKLNSSGKFMDGKFSMKRPKEILFKDPECPEHPKFSQIEQHIGAWRRLSKILPNGNLVIDGVDVTDIKQGRLADCWYVSALSVVALQPERLFKCLVDYSEEHGVYGFIFYKHGRWTVVIIDDFFPVGNKGLRKNKLIFSRSTDENETWVPLFEKAYAKLHGSYEGICSGKIFDGITDLTGGIGRIFKLDGISDKDKNLLWQQLKKCGEWRFIGCSISSTSGEKSLDNGLIAGHAYGVVRVYVHHDKRRLIQIRNPHASGKEWNGRWSDKSSLWKKYPDIAAAVDFKDEEDGMFWMCWADFIKTWTHVYSTRVFPETKKYTQLYDMSCEKGYQTYSFVLKTEKDVAIALDQYDLRYRQQLYEKYPVLGLTIRTADKSWSESVPNVARRSIGWWSTGKLQPNHYVIVARVKSSNPTPFCLRLYAPGKNPIVKGLKPPS